MGASENAARIRAGYESFNKGDIDGLIDLFDEDIVWRFPGASKLAGEHIGRDKVLETLGAYGAASGGTLQANVVDIMASDQHVTGWARDTASTDGRTLDLDSFVVFTMRDGKVTAAQHLVSDTDQLDAFLA